MSSGCRARPPSPARARCAASSRSRSPVHRAVAGAQTARAIDSPARRAEIDATANLWFAAQRESANLDLQIADAHQDAGRRRAAGRQAPRTSPTRGWSSSTRATSRRSSGILGGDPLEVGRRAALIGQANADGQAAIDKFEASIADLTARRRRAARRPQVTQAQHRSATSRAGAARSTPSSRRCSCARRVQRTGPGSPRRSGAPASRPRPPRPTRPAAIEVVRVDRRPRRRRPPHRSRPSTTGAVSPHHDDPFLVCTRARESDGDYSRRELARLLRRLPVLADHLERHRVARGPARPRRRAAVGRVGRTTRTRWRGRSTSGRATAPGAVAARRSRRVIAEAREHVGERAFGERPQAQVGRREVERLGERVAARSRSAARPPSPPRCRCGESSTASACAGSTPSRAHASR